MTDCFKKSEIKTARVRTAPPNAVTPPSSTVSDIRVPLAACEKMNVNDI